jgi:cyanophycin synthetase
LIELGALSAKFFEQIIVKEDDDTRGRPRGNAAELIVQGIHQGATDADALLPHSIRLDETEAIEWALDNAPENALVVIFPENVSRAIALIMSRDPIPDVMEAAFSSESKKDNLSMYETSSAGNNGKYSIK